MSWRYLFHVRFLCPIVLTTAPTAAMANTASSQDELTSAVLAWNRCLHGNMLSEVEKTPEHAVEVAFASCYGVENNVVDTILVKAGGSITDTSTIRKRLHDKLRPSLIKTVLDDRASDPELHATFADAVREDEIRWNRLKNAGSLPEIPKNTTTLRESMCKSFQSNRQYSTNDYETFIRAANNPALTQTRKDVFDAPSLDFKKDEFTTTSDHNKIRQAKWSELLGGSLNFLTVQQNLKPDQIRYNADTEILSIEIGSPTYGQDGAADGAMWQLHYAELRAKSQFRGGVYRTVNIFLPGHFLEGREVLGSYVYEIPMSASEAQKLKRNASIAFKFSLPIADDDTAPVLLEGFSSFGGAFKGDPRESVIAKRVFPSNPLCGGIFIGTQFITSIGKSR